MANPDFTRIFGSTGTSATITTTDYNAGWDNIAGTQPPTKTEFNAIDGEQDKKLAYLDKRSRGEWDATVDYLANEVALGVDGKWYKALVNNTNKEPSVSSSQWSIYDTSSVIINWKTVSSNTPAVKNDGLFIDTSASIITITLPASPSIGDIIFIEDAKGTFAANNIIIARNGELVMGLAEDMTVNIDYISFALVYSGATNGWRIL